MLYPDLGRSQRLCLKRSVFIRPKWFKPIQEIKRGFVYGIVPPREGRLNLIEEHEAEDAKTQLEVYISRLSMVCNVLTKCTFIGDLYKKVQDPDLIGLMSGHAEGSKALARY